MPNMSLTKVPMPEQAPNIRNKNFEEVTTGYTPEMAIEEAQRCLNCKHKPCVSGCPVGVQIPEFISLVARVNSWRLPLKSKKPLPCLPYAVACAHRKPSVSRSVCVPSKEKLLASVVWNALLQTMQWHTKQKLRQNRIPTDIRLLLLALVPPV